MYPPWIKQIFTKSNDMENDELRDIKQILTSSGEISK